MCQHLTIKAARRRQAPDLLNTGEEEMMEATFEMNGKFYVTDKETLSVLRSVMPSAKSSNDFSAVAAIMTLGQMTNRFREVLQ